VAELFTVAEMAARSGVAASTLRYYERIGLISASRTGGNQRRYQRAELRRLAFIRVSQQLGIPLDDIREALATLPSGRVPTRADWTRLSARWRHRLDERIALLVRLRDDLSSCIGCGCLSLRRCRLYNPDDTLARRGPGPRLLLEGPDPAGESPPSRSSP
jgi:MerR family redox-sensitive transcriptional activator SoxR